MGLQGDKLISLPKSKTKLNPTLLIFRLTPSSLPYYEFVTRRGDTVDFLIDTGSNKNYIQSTRIRNPLPNKPFKVESVAGTIEITHHTFIDIFGPNVEKLNSLSCHP